MSKSTICIMLCMIMGLTPPAWAQDEPQPVHERTTHSVGFIVNASESQLFKVQEDSNATLYDAYFQRLTKEGVLEPSDSKMPTLRLSQSIDPLKEVGTVEQLHAGVTSSAVSLMSALTTIGASELPSPTPCMQTIAAVERSGDRYEITDAQGDSWRVECFSFEDESGKGIGVVIKYRPDHETEALCIDALSDLTLIPLKSETPYTKVIAGYPLSLPVKSRLSDAKQIDENTISASIQLMHGTLTLHLMSIPQGYDVKTTAREQMSFAEEELRKSAIQGSASVLWSADSYIPSGWNGSMLVHGRVHSIAYPDGTDGHLAQYAHIDGQIILFAGFNGLQGDSQSLNRAASTLFTHAKGSERVSLKTFQVPGFEFDVPSNLSVWTHDDKPVRDVYYIAPFEFCTTQERLEGMMLRDPLTRIQFFNPGEVPELESHHRALTHHLMNEYRESEAVQFEGEVRGNAVTLDEGRVIQFARSSFSPQLRQDMKVLAGFHDLDLSLTSYLIESPSTGAACIVSTIANKKLSLHADAITLAQIKRLRATGTLDEFDLGFARVTVPRFAARLHREYDSFDDSYISLSTLGTEIEIYSSASSPRMEVLSSRLLASEHMPSKWRTVAYREEYELFPEDAQGLDVAPFAGKDALLFEARLEPMERIIGVGRNTPELIRMYGFVHNNRFITVVMKQSGDQIDPAGMDAWVDAFRH